MDTFGTDLASHTCVESSEPAIGSVADNQAPLKHDFIPRSDKEWAALEVRVARRAMVGGNVAAIRSLLAHQKAIAWIEAHSGEESMLDRSDPFIRDVIIPAKERLRERNRRRLTSSGTTTGIGFSFSAYRTS